ncbi:MAG: YdeI/OmpD-associated family protein [Bacteroidales bacterium]
MELYFRDREEWRRWLEQNSTSTEGIWIIYYKKKTGRQCIAYPDSVEEALCFGWIDGKIKRINDDYYLRWYTPRRMGSRWSKYNVERVEKLKKEGLMTQAGLRIYSEVLSRPDLVYDNRVSGEPEIPVDLLEALMKNETAHMNFMNFSDSVKKTFIGWLNDAKKEETRGRRIPRIVSAAESKIKPGINGIN